MPKFEMWELTSIWLQAHWFLLQLSGWSFDFDSHFYFAFFIFYFFISFIISRAALHGTWPCTPNYPSLLTQLFHHSPTPPPPSSHCTPNPSSPPITAVPDSWADGGVRSTRSMGGAAHTPSKLLLSDLPPGSGQARGLSAGIHPSPDQPTALTQSMESDLSHRIEFRIEYFKIKTY